MDVGLWDCLGKTCIIAKFKKNKTDLVICSHSRKRKTLLQPNKYGIMMQTIGMVSELTWI